MVKAWAIARKGRIALEWGINKLKSDFEFEPAPAFHEKFVRVEIKRID